MKQKVNQLLMELTVVITYPNNETIQEEVVNNEEVVPENETTVETEETVENPQENKEDSQEEEHRTFKFSDFTILF